MYLYGDCFFLQATCMVGHLTASYCTFMEGMDAGTATVQCICIANTQGLSYLIYMHIASCWLNFFKQLNSLPTAVCLMETISVPLTVMMFIDTLCG